jgi:uncharacterized membrane protein
MAIVSPTKQRVAYIDWMRGFACLAMFQTHCYDSWLSGPARKTQFFSWSQLGGTLPAPLFLFLAGVSVALATDRSWQQGIAVGHIARATMLRGLEVFGWGLLFRVQEFLLGQPGAPWTDLLRVDVLNIIGLSIVFLGALVGVVSGLSTRSTELKAGPLAPAVRARLMLGSAAAALAISMATPPLWTTHRPRFLPWFLESYINGVHIFDKPQPWLFPFFPWAAFACAGLAVGFFLLSPWGRRRQLAATASTAAFGAALGALAFWLDAQQRRIYAVYDFWHSSPEFFLIRVGIVMAIVFGAYAWCRWGLGQRGFSPLIELGKQSLVVYWVHIEFVYGRFSILAKGAQTILTASLGLLVIFTAMTALATILNRAKGRGLQAIAIWRRSHESAASLEVTEVTKER